MRNTMKAGLMAALALGAMASTGAAVAIKQEEARPLRDAFKPIPGGAVSSSANGGRRGRGMAAKRASVKARNVKRHRLACKRSA